MIESRVRALVWGSPEDAGAADAELAVQAAMHRNAMQAEAEARREALARAGAAAVSDAIRRGDPPEEVVAALRAALDAPLGAPATVVVSSRSTVSFGMPRATS
ncbi:MAG: hypothetical protein J7605_17290 [Variovorax sp.]|nr:hypothetical protein [Variovorax sp.]